LSDTINQAMSTRISTSPIEPIDEEPEGPFRITVAQYHAMIEAGVFADDDRRIELLEGQLVQKPMKKNPHVASTRKSRRTVEPLLPTGWFYDVQEPIELSDGEPEPDGMVVRGVPDDYGDRRVTASDAALVIEVADTSLRRDRGVKLRSYARAGVACYWIVNLIDRRVEVYTHPSGPTDEPAVTPSYAERVDVGPEGSVPLVLDGATVAAVRVADLLP